MPLPLTPVHRDLRELACGVVLLLENALPTTCVEANPSAARQASIVPNQVPVPRCSASAVTLAAAKVHNLAVGSKVDFAAALELPAEHLPGPLDP